MKIAITGTIGSGKSTVADYIRSKGFDVFDADKCNAKLLEKGNLGYLAIKKEFNEVFDGETLNKEKLANIVFNNKKLKDKLESIMHPLILDEMNKEADKNDIFFAEIPLLFEVGWNKYFDINILVTSDIEIALGRLVNRGMSNKEAIRRLNNQMSFDIKQKWVDEIIYNNKALNDLYYQIDEILKKYVG